MSTQALEQTERQLQQAVIDYARLNGWLVAHHHDSRREVRPGVWVGDKDAKGFPDLVLARGGRLVFAELKAENGRLSREQRAWLKVLGGEEDGSFPEDSLIRFLGGFPRIGRVFVRCWRPSDWPEIEMVLR